MSNRYHVSSASVIDARTALVVTACGKLFRVSNMLNPNQDWVQIHAPENPEAQIPTPPAESMVEVTEAEDSPDEVDDSPDEVDDSPEAKSPARKKKAVKPKATEPSDD